MKLNMKHVFFTNERWLNKLWDNHKRIHIYTKRIFLLKKLTLLIIQNDKNFWESWCTCLLLLLQNALSLTLTDILNLNCMCRMINYHLLTKCDHQIFHWRQKIFLNMIITIFFFINRVRIEMYIIKNRVENFKNINFQFVFNKKIKK